MLVVIPNGLEDDLVEEDSWHRGDGHASTETAYGVGFGEGDSSGNGFRIASKTLTGKGFSLGEGSAWGTGDGMGGLINTAKFT